MLRSIALICTAGLLAACGGGGGGVSPGPTAAGVATAQASTAPAGATTPGATPATTPIPGCLPGCVQMGLDVPGPLPAGVYDTSWFFGKQLRVPIPDDTWTADEDSTGELALRPRNKETLKVLWWLDVYPIVDGPFVRVEGYDGTAAALVEWLKANPNLVVSDEGTGHIGDLEAVSLHIERSPDAVNVDPECPPKDQPCVAMVSFYQWDGFYSAGGTFVNHFLAADTTWGGTPHAVYVMIESWDGDGFEAFDAVATKMVEGADLPLGVGT